MFIIDIDKDRRELLLILKQIDGMYNAMMELQSMADELEEKIFQESELEMIRRS